MRKLLLLGGLAALLLVVGPMLVASAEEGGRRAKGAPAADAGKERGAPAPIVLTPEQEGKMEAEILAFRNALDKLLAKANEVLGPDVAPKYVLQAAFKAIRPADREGGKDKAKPKESKRGK